MRYSSEIDLHSLLRVEAGHIVAFTLICFSETSSGVCPPTMARLMARRNSLLLPSVALKLGHCFPFFDLRFHFYCLYHCIATACLKTWKRFLAALPVTTHLIPIIALCAFFSSSRYPPSLGKIHACYHCHSCYNTILHQAWTMASFLIRYHLLLICQDSPQFLVYHRVSLFSKNDYRFWKYTFSLICMDLREKGKAYSMFHTCSL